jgi:hypothetical protein
LEFRKHDRRFAVALVAAAVLVLQSVFSAWASAAPQAPMLDAFGNPLCITSADGHAPGPAGGHSKPSDCCMLGCAGIAHALAASADATAGLVHQPVPRDVAYAAPRQISLEPADHNPGSPRAPPLTI